MSVPTVDNQAPRGASDDITLWVPNTLATWSLVLALVWGGGLLSIPAVFFGHMAWKQTGERGQDGRPVALLGLIVGYVGLGAAVIFWVFFAALVGTVGTLGDAAIGPFTDIPPPISLSEYEQCVDDAMAQGDVYAAAEC